MKAVHRFLAMIYINFIKQSFLYMAYRRYGSSYSRYGRRRNRMRGGNSVFSQENFNFLLEINLNANSWGQVNGCLVAAINTLGVRRLRKCKLTIFKNQAMPCLFALVFKPEGMANLSNIAHGIMNNGAGVSATSYEPNQHVLVSGQVTDVAGVFYSNGRNLSSGDEIHLCISSYNGDVNNAATHRFHVTFSYQISF